MIFHGFTGRGYERHGIFNLEEVFLNLGHQVKFNGKIISLTSDRYYLFAQGRVCVKCGLEGLYFAKERSAKKLMKRNPEGKGHHAVWVRARDGQRWHLNMYALDWDEKLNRWVEVLMTKDHIIPRALGGPDEASNYQTMCIRCNGSKADKITHPIPIPTIQGALLQ